MTTTADGRCPCGSGDAYRHCCGRFHSGASTAPTAEGLMRSRFSAFVRADPNYLLRTWLPSTRPGELALDAGITWNHLEILEIVSGGPFDTTGIVEFRAHYRTAAGRSAQHERSRFVREGGQWFYVDGVRPPS